MACFQLIGIVASLLISAKVVYNVGHFLYTVFLGAILKKNIDLKKYGPWAVVTGSTDGIGKAYAFNLASKGLNVVLVSRNPEKLRNVAQEIERKYGSVKTKTIAVDFTDASDAVYGKLSSELSKLDIGILINNVGMVSQDLCPFFRMKDNDRYCQDIINCNAMSVPRVTNVVLPGMLAKKKGIIINVSSLSAALPTPFFTIYGATKAFVDKFSADLRTEVEQHGIVVQTVLPGYVSTNMTRTVPRRIDNPLPETFVQAQLRTLGLESRTAGYWLHKIQLYIGEVARFFAPETSSRLILKLILKTRKNDITNH